MLSKAGSILIFLLAAASVFSQARSFDVQEVADGVYAVIRREPASFWFNANNVFIVGKHDVIVVDSNLTVGYTKEVIAALREITDKPVKYVINTHWHEDHIIGNRAYREAFPGVKFVGHRSTLKDLPEVGGGNRQGSLKNGRGFVGMLESSLEKGESIAGGAITDEERAGYASDIKFVSSYLAESSTFEIILPDVLVDDRLEIKQDGRTVEVLFLGRAHTGADLVVNLPKERIAITGDLMVYPVPLLGSTSYPLEYATTLEKLKGLGSRMYIPGHGPVMKDDVYLDKTIALATAVRDRSRAAYKPGETVEQMRAKIDLSDQQKVFAGDSRHKGFIFRNYVTLPATAAAFKHLGEGK
ncbi:MAG TPA: MBL fold metallo-hydrolase [Pyrinomonadaceae bacterium]|nr:MBL fold metallo-hydrolase [Pyrinomonadaceae bacterium]